MINLTKREREELVWFVATVQRWREGGPYGDGDSIIEKKGYALMDKILAKLQKSD